MASYPQAGVSPGPVRGSQGYWVLPPLFAQSNKVQGPVDQPHLWLVPCDQVCAFTAGFMTNMTRVTMRESDVKSLLLLLLLIHTSFH